MADADILVRSRLERRSDFESADALKRALAELLARNPRVRAAYLFGSFVREDRHSHSDVDLIVVADTQRPFLERYLDFSDLFDRVPELDLLIYTEPEIERLRRDPSPGFWRSVWREAEELDLRRY